MKDKDLLQLFIGVGRYFATLLGPSCEVIVHDVANLDHTLIAIFNNQTNRKVGDPITDFALEMLNDKVYEKQDSVTGYLGKYKNKEFISSTYFIKNEGRLIGLLCVNKDLAGIKNVYSTLNKVFEGFNITLPSNENETENFENPVSSMINGIIKEVISKEGVAPERLSKEEKIEIVHKLRDNGVLMMKGALAEVASELHVSVPSVYRYLNED